jgi:hypothetical protein
MFTKFGAAFGHAIRFQPFARRAHTKASMGESYSFDLPSPNGAALVMGGALLAGVAGLSLASGTMSRYQKNAFSEEVRGRLRSLFLSFDAGLVVIAGSAAWSIAHPDFKWMARNVGVEWPLTMIAAIPIALTLSRDESYYGTAGRSVNWVLGHILIGTTVSRMLLKDGALAARAFSYIGGASVGISLAAGSASNDAALSEIAPVSAALGLVAGHLIGSAYFPEVNIGGKYYIRNAFVYGTFGLFPLILLAGINRHKNRALNHEKYTGFGQEAHVFTDYLLAPLIFMRRFFVPSWYDSNEPGVPNSHH